MPNILARLRILFNHLWYNIYYKRDTLQGAFVLCSIGVIVYSLGILVNDACVRLALLGLEKSALVAAATSNDAPGP